MQKRLVVIVLLLSLAAFAAENLESDFEPGIPRYHDFPLDNIHILRLQDAASALGGNVSLLKNDLHTYETQRSREIQELRDSVNRVEGRLMSQIQGMQAAIDVAAQNRPNVDVPAPPQQGMPVYLVVLIGINIFLLLIIAVLVVFLLEQHRKQKPKKDDAKKNDEHIHPAPKELIEYVSKQLSKKSVHDIRMELLQKGWMPSIIEHAIHAAKER